MKITEDVRKHAAEQGVTAEEALKRGMQAKSKEFVEKERRFTRRRDFHGPRLCAQHQPQKRPSIKTAPD